MWKYCGTRLRVLKKVEKICLENEPRTVQKLENTVILEGAYCKGSGIDCDRACFYFLARMLVEKNRCYCQLQLRLKHRISAR